MNVHAKLIIAIATAGLAGAVAAQSATTSVGRAASAAVTPGDQDLGRNPANRSGGIMGNDRAGTGSAATGVGRAASAAVTPGDQDLGRNPANRSGGMMGTDRAVTGSGTTSDTRPARADRG